MNEQLGIVDYRNIVKAVSETHDLDMSNFALTSLKRRFERVIMLNNMTSADELINRIRTDKDFLEVFLSNTAVGETEMFRDPSMWREIRDKMLPKIVDGQDSRILLSCVTSGEELFSIAILLREAGVSEKVMISATSISERNINLIKKGTYDLKKMEMYAANYNRFNPAGDFSDYFSMSGSRIVMDSTLLSNVTFKRHNIFTESLDLKMKLVIFRNKMIYMNQSLQNRAIEQLDKNLLPGGFIVIGIKELFDGQSASGKYIAYNKSESIYKKVSN